jgi:16S rRNA (uracil1498-N3)-methyltransferase
MTRCFLPPESWEEIPPRLSESESHHLLRVRRGREGDRVRVFDGAGRSADAEIVATAGGRAVLRLGEPRRSPPPRLARILIQAMPKHPKPEAIVEKAVELGASAVWFVNAERSVPRPSAEAAAERCERWRAVAVAAAKQCGQDRLPELAWLESVEAAVRRAAGRRQILCALEAGARPLRDVLRSGGLADAPSVVAWVGPEGDFSPDEARRIVAAGAIPARLGPLTLRTETAALYVLCILAYET